MLDKFQQPSDSVLQELGLTKFEILETRALVSLVNLKWHPLKRAGAAGIKSSLVAQKKVPDSVAYSIGYYVQQLTAKGYSNEQVERLAQSAGKLPSLDAVEKKHYKLIALNFTREQIIQLAANFGGSNLMEAVITHFTFLHDAGFTHKDIVEIGTCSKRTGAERLELLVDNYHKLKITHESILLNFKDIYSVTSLKNWIKQTLTDTIPQSPEIPVFTHAPR